MVRYWHIILQNSIYLSFHFLCLFCINMEIHQKCSPIFFPILKLTLILLLDSWLLIFFKNQFIYLSTFCDFFALTWKFNRNVHPFSFSILKLTLILLLDCWLFIFSHKTHVTAWEEKKGYICSGHVRKNEKSTIKKKN